MIWGVQLTGVWLATVGWAMPAMAEGASTRPARAAAAATPRRRLRIRDPFEGEHIQPTCVRGTHNPGGSAPPRPVLHARRAHGGAASDDGARPPPAPVDADDVRLDVGGVG